MALPPEILKSLVATFRAELAEHLQGISDQLLLVEGGLSDDERTEARDVAIV
ncbi:MAG: hypothetical protein HOB79_17250 [Rhodospirillaceae bacterium]|nr:hypothetical protein [Rhodospirillaceae bacterium]